MVGQVWKPSTRQAEAGGLLQVQPGLHTEFQASPAIRPCIQNRTKDTTIKNHLERGHGHPTVASTGVNIRTRLLTKISPQALFRKSPCPQRHRNSRSLSSKMWSHTPPQGTEEQPLPLPAWGRWGRRNFSQQKNTSQSQEEL